MPLRNFSDFFNLDKYHLYCFYAKLFALLKSHIKDSITIIKWPLRALTSL